jgi:hypothetical protein
MERFGQNKHNYIYNSNSNSKFLLGLGSHAWWIITAQYIHVKIYENKNKDKTYIIRLSKVLTPLPDSKF